MFNLFKKKCPVCKMELEEGEHYPSGFGKKFCSDECREEYRKKLVKEQSGASGGGRCH